MPMKDADDFALKNLESAYCKYCTDEKGKLLPFEKILKSNTSYYMESQGITEQAALKMARDLLTSQPAWKEKRA
jgi:hypothetical protein